MQAGTHIAGAALTAAVLRGFGVEVGPPEVLALVVGSLLPDIDTTTSGTGRFVKPVSRLIETKFGHRTLTHSLLFTVLFSVIWWPLSPSLATAFFWGILSHLLLDTLNVNGVPLLWPGRLMFWFWPRRSMRIKYGSSGETSVALVCAVVALVLWPIGTDGFNSAFRRLVASPETAVADYIDMRQDRDVWASLEGFNSETQEPMKGNYRIIEAIGRNGVLVEDQQGNAYQVSKFGQVVAYRIRAYGGAPIVWRDYRLDVGSRLLGDVLTALPAGATNVYLTGVLEISGEVNPPPAEVGTFARVSLRQGTDNILELHAARPVDVQALRNAYIRTGSVVVRAEFAPGKEVDTLPLTAQDGPTPTVQAIKIDGLPSMAGLLVQNGDRVLEGEPLARFVRPHETAALDASMKEKQTALLDAQKKLAGLAEHYRALKAPALAEVQAARENVTRFEQLVKADAATRLELLDAQQKAAQAQTKLDQIAMGQAQATTDAEARARALALDVKTLTAKRDATTAAQVVRSPVAGSVVEIRNKGSTVHGLTVEVVILSRDMTQAPSSEVKPGVKNETF